MPEWLKKLFSRMPENDDSPGDRIFNKTVEAANNAKTDEERKKIYNDSAKNNLAVTGMSLMSIPMLNEFATYGLVGGGLRVGSGLVGSKVGEYTLGKAGDYGDKKLNTNFLGTTGRILGGFAGYGVTMKPTMNLLRTAAGKDITLHMPQDAFSNLRSEYFKNWSKGINHYGPLRHVEISELSPDEFTGAVIEPGTKFNETKLIDTLTGKFIGNMYTATFPKGDTGVNWIENTSAYKHWPMPQNNRYVTHWLHRGVSRGLYNGMIPHTNGLDSGWDQLLLPDKTKAVWKHFKYTPLEKGVKLERQESFVPTLGTKIKELPKPQPINIKTITLEKAINNPYEGENYIWHRTPLFKEQITENETRAIAPSLGVSRLSDLNWEIASNKSTPANLYEDFAFIGGKPSLLQNSILFYKDGNTPTVKHVWGTHYVPSKERQNVANWILWMQNQRGFNSAPKINLEQLKKLHLGNQEYFEAKYQGLLPLEKFKYGLFPEGKETVPYINFFKDKGLNIKLYSPNESGNYEKVLKEILDNDPDILFKNGGEIK